MTDPKLEVPAELRELVERRIDHAEKAAALFFDAARRSTATSGISALELSKQVLAFSEESLKTGFEHARKLAAIATIQELAAAQSKLVKSQIAGAERHIRELARTSRSKDPT
jgi:hypothetical protein